MKGGSPQNDSHMFYDKPGRRERDWDQGMMVLEGDVKGQTGDSAESNVNNRKNEEDLRFNKQYLAVRRTGKKLGLQPQSSLQIKIIRSPEPLLIIVTKRGWSTEKSSS